MKAPNKTRILLQQALELDTEARTLLLETIADTDLKSQVETLLADEAQLQEFLQKKRTFDVSNDSQQNHIGPGSLINRIRIEKLLGQGGMGSVYLGFDEKLERQVAVKSIRPEHLQNPATQQRFVREAQILSKINHHSICQLYDYIETAQGDFLVLEYIKGKPLYKSPMTYEQKLNAMADLAAALSVAHEHGIVHRDLKPDNIMITDEGQLKVLDFGIAQSLSKPKVSSAFQTSQLSNDLTQQGSLVGTIRYMSPEQAQGQNIETASDMYAMGIIALEVFSHKAAYQVMETEQLLTDVQQGNRVQAIDLPRPITKLIEDLTQLNPSQRPTALASVELVNMIINAPKQKQKKIIKYSVIIAGLMLLLLLLWQWQQFNHQSGMNELVKGYENQINALVKQAEQIYMLPIHPVDEEINWVLQQGNELYGVIMNDEQLNETAKKRLLGIVLLKGEYYADAIPLLMEGQAESHLLADAWTMLYIEKATEFSDEHGMEQTMNDAALKENYLDPALNYIEQAHQEAGQVNPLFHSFEVSQTQSLDAGLMAVNQILATEQWNKNAVNLKAMILSASMTHARETGQWGQAKAYALMTAETYQRSTEMARSYPPGYASLCLLNLGLMSDGIQRSGKQVTDFAEQSIEACENALLLQPENKYPMQLLATIYMMKAQWQTNQGINADDSLSLAKKWNQQAGALDDLFSSSWRQALILATEAKQLLLNGAVAQPVFDQAQNLFNNMLEVDTELRPYVVSDALYLLALRAHEMIRHNQSPAAIFQRAQDLFDETILTPDLMISEQWGLVNNMAQVYWVRLKGQYEHGENILSQGNKLLAFLSPSDSMVKNDPQQLITLANTHLLMADYLRLQQQPIADHLNLAADYITQALSINSTDYSILLSQASLKTLQSYYSEQDYTQSNQIFKRALTANPTNPYSQQAWATSLLIQAHNSQTSTEQINALKLAHEKINRALSVDESNQTFNNTRVEILEFAESIGVDLGR